MYACFKGFEILGFFRVVRMKFLWVLDIMTFSFSWIYIPHEIRYEL